MQGLVLGKAKTTEFQNIWSNKHEVQELWNRTSIYLYNMKFSCVFFWATFLLEYIYKVVLIMLFWTGVFSHLV